MRCAGPHALRCRGSPGQFDRHSALPVRAMGLAYAGVLMACAASAGRAQAPVNPLAEVSDRQSETLEPGLIHTHIVGAAVRGRDPWSAHLLTVDLGRYRVDVAIGMDQIVGRETTSALVARRNAPAGVNGGFFVTGDAEVGDPDGFLVVDGVILSEPVGNRPSVGFCQQAGSLEPRVLRPVVTIETEPLVAGDPPSLNRARAEDDLVLYTPSWGRETRTAAGGVEIVVTDGSVSAITVAGSARIPANGFVLSASGSRIDGLRPAYPPGTLISYEVRVTDEVGRTVDLESCDFTTAGPVVARDGRVRDDYAGEAYREGFVADRHPRTAVGWSADGATLYLFTIDGRQAGYSAGATLTELATLLVAEGASTVYNLDGGGSTTMVVRGSGVVNRPSDGRERQPSDVLIVTSKR